MKRIFPHTDLKFQIKAEQENFNLRRDKWEVKIHDFFGRFVMEFTKRECIRDTEGNFYFTMEDVPTGIYIANFFGSYEDEDYAKQERVFTDVQEFLRVNMDDKYPCPSMEHVVSYTQVTTASLDGEDYLCDMDGNPILTAEGEKIYFINSIDKEDEQMGKVKLNMTGDDFKKLIEGDEPNSEVNTIPEVMHAMQGISDDTTIKQEIKDDAGSTYDGDTRTLYINGAKPKEED